MKKFPVLFSAALAALLISSASHVLAHAGHDKAPGEGGESVTSGAIAITAEAKRNLGIKVEEVELRTLEKTFMVIGQIEAIPNHSAAVSSRVAGRVIEIKATEGQTVKKGEPLVEIESRQVGNPPPHVQYEAPIDGVVTHRDVLLNDAVGPDKHLLEIVDLAEVYAEGRIFEGEVARVKPGQKVRVHVESFPGETFTGTVDLVGGALEAETRTLKVWVRVANPDARLRPNMRAMLHIVTDEADSVVAVPHSAVLGDAGNLFAFVQADNDGLIYERRAVVTGIKDDRYIEIVEGIFPSDKVVTLGNYQLQYVTTRPKKAVAGASAAGHEHETAARSHSAIFSIVKWLGVLSVLALFLYIWARVARRRRPEIVAAHAPPRPSYSPQETPLR
jgi:multidrug efflux pump subunit AcrA (membrane-fusion protein)